MSRELPVREAEERPLGGAGVAPGGEGVERRWASETTRNVVADPSGTARETSGASISKTSWLARAGGSGHPRARHISGGARLCTIAIPAILSCISCKGVKVALTTAGLGGCSLFVL